MEGTIIVVRIRDIWEMLRNSGRSFYPRRRGGPLREAIGVLRAQKKGDTGLRPGPPGPSVPSRRGLVAARYLDPTDGP